MRRLIENLGLSVIASGRRLPIASLGMMKSYAKYAAIKDRLDHLKINCVLDIGANEGHYAQILRQIGYNGYIVSFEPDPEVFDKLSGRFKNDAFWKGYNVALGTENTTAKFNISTYSVFNSFLKPKTDTPQVSHECVVEVKRLDVLFGEIAALVQKPKFFLKADTQGFDFEVIKGAKGCINEILLLQSEVSVQALYDGSPYYLDSLRYYESLGFRLIDLFSVVRDAKDCIVEYDCLMIRPVDE